METEGTFCITHAEEDSAVLKNVESGQVHTLSENPGVETGDVLTGTITTEPPLDVTWTLISVDERRSITLEQSDELPTTRERTLASQQEVGDITREERAGDGEIHVITVPHEDEDTSDESSTNEASEQNENEEMNKIDQIIQDVLDDDATLVRAARLGATRVEVRSDADTGVVSVRYLP
ncbi:DUF5812 family protein [Halocatena marina]|uniref:DUF5812 family protein n=1 Tax=Halocatena marina TaxID=2934937 RepID=A0ABD5YU82_9EURY|nr:DUF5812 family protein [Halocatena marina]